jgi:hypothetical protein
VRITRPAGINHIEAWSVVNVSGTGLATSLNIPIATNYVDLGPVNDNQIVSASIVWIDTDTNTQSNASNQSAVTIGDKTAPILGALVHTDVVTTSITCNVTEPNSSIAQATLFINNIDRAAELSIIGNNIVFTPATAFAYGLPLDITLNVIDGSGNSATINSSFTITTNIPVPAAPTITWLPSATNSADNQYVRITRPAGINHIEAWSVVNVSGTGLATSLNIPIATNYVDLGPVNDNQIVSASIVWIDTDTNTQSNASNQSAVTIGDKTAPILGALVHTDVVTTSITCNVTEPNSSIAQATLFINNIDRAAELSIIGNNIVFTPATAFAYGLPLDITLNVIDGSGNSATINSSFAITTNIPVPAAPTITWIPSGVNAYNRQTVRVTRPETINHIEAWSVVNVAGSGMAASLNIPIATTYIDIGPINDNQIVSAAIVWVDLDTGVSSSPSIITPEIIGDRTPPYLIATTPSSFAADQPTSSVIYFTFGDQNSLINSTNATLFVNGLDVSSSVNYSAGTFSFIPQNNYYYGTTVFVTTNVKDIIGNNTTISYQFNIHQDSIPPVVDNISYSGSVTTSIVFSYSDSETEVSSNSVRLFINNVDRSAELTANSTVATFNPTTAFAYGQQLDVTINLGDIFDNYSSTAFSMTTDIPPTPDAPTIEWLDEGGVNSADNQYIRISRPATINHVEAWSIINVVGSGLYTMSNIPAETQFVDIGPANDAQIVSASIVWIDLHTGSVSPTSNPSMTTIDDRTPPYLIATTPNNLATNQPTSSVIYFSFGDQNSLINSTNATLFVNGLDVSSSVNYSNGIFSYAPPINYNYGTTVLAVANGKDIIGNNTTVNFQFDIHSDITPPVINNITYSTSVTTPISFSYSDIETGVSINSLRIFINGFDRSAELTSIEISGATFNPTIAFAYGEPLAITINLNDISGNYSSATFSITTNIPPTPDTPTIEWLSSGINTNDNQYVKITRPTTIANIEQWSVVNTVGIPSSYNIPIATTAVTLGPVNDNQVVSASIVWIDTDTGAQSLTSNQSTAIIGDKTPPWIDTYVPASGSINVPATTDITFVIHDANSSINTAATTISLNALNFTTTDISFSGSAGLIQARLIIPGGVSYNATQRVTINVADVSGNTYQVSYSFTTMPTFLNTLTFNMTTMAVIAEASYTVTVTAYDILNNPMPNQIISFMVTTTNPASFTTYFIPAQATTNGLGKATANIYVGSGNATVTISAQNGGVSAPPASITVTGLIRPFSNQRLAKSYLTLPEAFADTSLNAYDVIVIDPSYDQALPSQHISTVLWPSANNITLAGKPTTIDFQIQIITQNGFATITSLNINNLSSPILINAPGSTINISNCNFNNNTTAIAGTAAQNLTITNCKFIGNTSGSNGGAISLIGLNKYVTIRQSRFFNNSANNGSALYVNNANSVINLENSIIADNSTTALDLYINSITVNFSTIANNPQGIIIRQGLLAIKNSILWNTLDLATENAALATCQRSITSINIGSTDVLHSDPGLILPSYKISISSPAYNYGMDSSTTLDIDNTPRPQWGVSDCGAYELLTAQPVSIVGKQFYNTINDAFAAAIPGDIIELNAGTYNIATTLNWPAVSNLTVRGQAALPSTSVVINGQSHALFEVTNNNINLTLGNLTVTSANNVFVVNTSQPGVITISTVNIKNCSAYTSIQNGSIIYTDQPITANIKNCSFINNRAQADGGLFFSRIGKMNLSFDTVLVSGAASDAGHGGIAANAILHIKNSTGNAYTTFMGGGAFHNADVVAQDSSFSNGQTNADGAFATSSNIEALRCIFKDHDSWSSGGLFFHCLISINNSILYNNKANLANTGLADSSSYITINNSVLWSNSNEFNYIPGHTAITYSDCEHPYPGLGNISVSPGFINPGNNNFQPTFNSPLIDAGNGPAYTYDAQDIGFYEYANTYINQIQPTPGSSDIPTTANLSFRIRNASQLYAPGAVDIIINGVRYQYPTPNLIITNNSSAVSTDLLITIAPTPSFRFGDTVTVSIGGVGISYTYTMNTHRPDIIYVSLSGDDGNDGSLEHPLRTITKGFAIAQNNGIIKLADGSYAENFTWPNLNNITLRGSTQSVLNGIMTLPYPVTASIETLTLRAVANQARLVIQNSIISGNLTTINNQQSLTLINTLVTKLNQPITNNGTFSAINCNFVSNNIVLNTPGIANAVNCIFYQNNLIASNGSLTTDHCFVGNPFFADNTYTKVIFNSPVIDAGTTTTVTSDYRGMVRPQHYAQDIGLYESEFPNIIILAPSGNSVPITSSIVCQVIDNPEQLVTTGITINYAGTTTASATGIGYLVTLNPIVFFDTSTNYTVTISATDASGNMSIATASFRTQPHLDTLYVDQASALSNAVGLAEYPFKTIQAALNYIHNKALVSSSITVASGSYTESLTISNNPLSVSRSISIQGTNAIVSGSGTARLLNLGQNNSLSMSGLTFKNGLLTSSSGGAACFIDRSYVTINQCLFTNNKAINNLSIRGGALYINNSKVLITGSILEGNVCSVNGGALYATGSSVTLSGTVVSGNNSDQDGAGIYCDASSAVYIVRSIISNNDSGRHGGGIANTGSTITLQNSIVRKNKAQQNGGGISNGTSGTITAINSVFDYNQSLGTSGTNGGGAIYNTRIINIYNCDFIQNTTQGFGGAIFHSYTTSLITNTLFYQNTAPNNPTLKNIHVFSGGLTFTNGLPSAMNGADVDPRFANPSLFDYHYLNGSPCIDTGTALPATVPQDYDAAARPLDGNGNGSAEYDIGIYEYAFDGLHIPAEPGYYVVDELGSDQHISPTATITIGRILNGSFVGSITIPSSNGINVRDSSFSTIIITPNAITIPGGSILNGKLFTITLPSTKYPFISFNNTIRSEYDGSVTRNSDAVISGNASIGISGNYLISFNATAAGTYSTTQVTSLRFAQTLINNNHNQSSALTLLTTIGNTPITGIPVTLSVSSNGYFDAPVVTNNGVFHHGAFAEVTVITANFESLIATIAATTYVDDQPPTVNIISPLGSTDIPVTTALDILVTDNYSDLAAVSILLNGADITALCTLSNSHYRYTQRFAINSHYAVTVNARDGGNNTTQVVFQFQTKDDTTAPVLQLFPTAGQLNVASDTTIAINANDYESGISINSISLEVNDVLTTPIINQTSAYAATITYQPTTPFALTSTVFVTFNITDILGNTRQTAYLFQITDDQNPPVILSISPVPGSTVSATIPITVFSGDLESGIATNNITFLINNTLVTAGALSIQGTNPCTVSYTGRIPYNTAINVTGSIVDTKGNTSIITWSYTTQPDTVAPVITPLFPTAGATNVSRDITITARLTDDQTGIRQGFYSIRINGGTPINLSSYITAVDTYNYLVSYPLPQVPYGVTTSVELTCYDNVNNQNTLVYTFRTEADIYPPTTPIVQALPTGPTTNLTRFTLTGSADTNTMLYVYNGTTLLTSLGITGPATTASFTIPLAFTQTGSVTLAIVSIDQAGNHSTTVNLSPFSIEDRPLQLIIDQTTINITIPAGAFDQETSVTASTTNVFASSSAMKIHYTVDLSAHPVSGVGAIQQYGPVTVTLPIPSGNIDTRGISIYYFDSSSNTWKNNGITVTNISTTQITFTTTHFSIFGIVTILNTTNLGKDTWMIAPNPVPLESEPVHFVYNSANPGTAKVRIYSLSGSLITSFEENIQAGLHEFTWNGNNSYNQTIANGVYLVIVTVEDNAGNKYTTRLKLAVLN